MHDPETIRATLLKRLKQLVTRADQIDDDLSKEADDDWDDNAIEAEGDEVLEGVGQAALLEIGHIRGALAALRDGTYGTCVECGDEIAPARLAALPETTRCKLCAS